MANVRPSPPAPAQVPAPGILALRDRRRGSWFEAQGPLGWWPLLNLVYLFFAYLPLLFDPRADLQAFAATTVAVLVFLPLYFAGYAASGARAVLLMAAIAAVGFALMPINAGGYTFVIYAIALAAHVLDVRGLAWTMVVLLGLMSLQVGWLGIPWAFVGVTAALAVMISIGTVYGRIDARRNAALRLSQEEVRRLARSAERERIGRDLHDLLGHTLSLVALKSELALKLLERDPAAARAEMEAVERVTRDALAQVRRAVSGIRAAGVEAELSSARLSLLSGGVVLDYRLAPLVLPVETETVLALAVREAITNVVRHAGATSVEVELASEGDMARLSVVDDGRGAALVAGNGLNGMRERVEALGGAMEIASTPGEGTRLLVRVPLAPALVDGGGAP